MQQLVLPGRPLHFFRGLWRCKRPLLLFLSFDQREPVGGGAWKVWGCSSQQQQQQRQQLCFWQLSYFRPRFDWVRVSRYLCVFFHSSGSLRWSACVCEGTGPTRDPGLGQRARGREMVRSNHPECSYSGSFKIKRLHLQTSDHIIDSYKQINNVFIYIRIWYILVYNIFPHLFLLLNSNYCSIKSLPI